MSRQDILLWEYNFLYGLPRIMPWRSQTWCVEIKKLETSNITHLPRVIKASRRKGGGKQSFSCCQFLAGYLLGRMLTQNTGELLLDYSVLHPKRQHPSWSPLSEHPAEQTIINDIITLGFPVLRRPSTLGSSKDDEITKGAWLSQLLGMVSWNMPYHPWPL